MNEDNNKFNCKSYNNLNIFIYLLKRQFFFLTKSAHDEWLTSYFKFLFVINYLKISMDINHPLTNIRYWEKKAYIRLSLM